MTELFDEFWNKYPASKSSKGAARKAFEKVIERHGKEIFKTLLLAIQAQAIYREEARLAGEFIPQWKMPSTWLNQECWDDEIPSHGKLKEKLNSKICSYGDCDQPVMGLKFDTCDKHYADKHSDFELNINYLKANNLYKTHGETARDWCNRCRNHLEKSGQLKKLLSV